MRPSVVVEVDGKCYGSYDFAYASEDLALEQFVLHRVVYALSLGVVLRVARLRHAYLYAVLTECVHVLTAGVLTSPVGVMDEIDLLALYAPQGHSESLHRILGVKSWADTPAGDLLRICIKDERQVTEVVMAVIVHYDDISYVANPQLIGGCRYV